MLFATIVKGAPEETTPEQFLRSSICQLIAYTAAKKGLKVLQQDVFYGRLTYAQANEVGEELIKKSFVELSNALADHMKDVADKDLFEAAVSIMGIQECPMPDSYFAFVKFDNRKERNENKCN